MDVFSEHSVCMFGLWDMIRRSRDCLGCKSGALQMFLLTYLFTYMSVCLSVCLSVCMLWLCAETRSTRKQCIKSWRKSICRVFRSLSSPEKVNFQCFTYIYVCVCTIYVWHKATDGCAVYCILCGHCVENKVKISWSSISLIICSMCCENTNIRICISHRWD